MDEAEAIKFLIRYNRAVARAKRGVPGSRTQQAAAQLAYDMLQVLLKSLITEEEPMYDRIIKAFRVNHADHVPLPVAEHANAVRVPVYADQDNVWPGCTITRLPSGKTYRVTLDDGRTTDLPTPEEAFQWFELNSDEFVE